MQITLYDKQGNEIKATVKHNSIDVSSKVQEEAMRLKTLREERGAIFDKLAEANKEFAEVEIEFTIDPVANKDRYETASKRRDAIQKLVGKKDAAILESTLAELKHIVTISKGDAKEVPEVDWKKTKSQTIAEALNFFLNGKLPSPPAAESGGENG